MSIDRNEFMRMLGLEGAGRQDEDTPVPTPLMQQAHADHLRELMHRYCCTIEDPLQLGDLVVYKEGLAITHVPSPGRPAILIDVFPDTRGTDLNINGMTPYGAELYNCTVAVTVKEHPDTLVFFFSNLARLEKYVAPFDNDEE